MVLVHAQVTADDRRWPVGFQGLPPRTGKLPGFDKFDASFFSVHGKQAQRMDPQLRKLLEVAYEAWVDTGGRKKACFALVIAVNLACQNAHPMFFPAQYWAGRLVFRAGQKDVVLQAWTSTRCEAATAWAATLGPVALRCTGSGCRTCRASRVCAQPSLPCSLFTVLPQARMQKFS